MKRILIIDDHTPARAALRALLVGHPDITMIAEIETMAEAESRLRVGDYDLVFLDIELRGGTGFDLVPLVRPEARVVFVTAYDQFAIRAFEINALDYLLKPVRAARLAEALRRMAPAPDFSVLPHPPARMAPDDLIYLKTGAGTSCFVALTELVLIEADENYSTVHLGNGTRLFVRRTMKVWEDTLPAPHFARVHRGTIINLARYRGSTRETRETLLVQCDGLAEPVRASFRYLPELRTRLQAIGRQL